MSPARHRATGTSRLAGLSGPGAVLRQIGAVGIGIAVLGLASSAYLSISGRALGPAAFAPLGTLWILVNAAGPALFQPLEQELGRGIAHARAIGTGARSLLLRSGTLALALLGLVGIVLLAAHRPAADRLFAGDDALVLALFLGLAGLAAEALCRGAFAGTADFGRYGLQLGLDGVLRLVGSLGLWIAGSAVAGWYGLVLGLAPVLAVVLTVRGVGGTATAPGQPEAWGRLMRALGLLTVGGLLQQFVINAPGVVAQLLASPAEQALAGTFIGVLVLARMPLFLFTAIQATFLPSLAALAARDDRPGFARRARGVMLAVAGMGLAGVTLVAVAGPQLVVLFYGADYRTSRMVLVVLALGSTFVMFGSALSQILISMRSYRSPLLGWSCGSVVFLLALLAPLGLEYRVGLAFLASTVVTSAVLAGGLTRRMRRPLNVDGPALEESL